MILSDRTLLNLISQKSIVIDPFNPADVQPASVDLHLDSKLLIFDKSKTAVIDPSIPVEMSEVNISEQGTLLEPGQFALGATLESVGVPNGLVGRLEGKSSLARLGLLVHVTAGFIDPGWLPAQITLEFCNLAPVPIILRPNMKIAQISFERVDQDSAKPYGHKDLNSKYQGQTGPTASKYYQN
jgi:dCTP deaminase